MGHKIYQYSALMKFQPPTIIALYMELIIFWVRLGMLVKDTGFLLKKKWLKLS